MKRDPDPADGETTSRGTAEDACRDGAQSFARLESKPLLGGILRGGLHDPRRLHDHCLDELRRVGRRSGYPVVARAIYCNMESLIDARERCARIEVPVTLVYGDEDWSRPSDRQALA